MDARTRQILKPLARPAAFFLLAALARRTAHAMARLAVCFLT
jgi:hypothetical protein